MAQADDFLCSSAQEVLDRLRHIPFLDRPPARQPYVLLSAVLENALTPSSIAQDILRAITGDSNTFIPNLQRLTDYYYTTLLVPRFSSLMFYLIVVRREGGKTPAMSDHPSDFDQRLVTRRWTDREKVCYINHFTVANTGVTSF